jgi:hypothetical protein
LNAAVDHLDDGGDLLLAVGVEHLAVLSLDRLELLQILNGVSEAVVGVFLDVTYLNSKKTTLNLTTCHIQRSGLNIK